LYSLFFFKVGASWFFSVLIKIILFQGPHSLIATGVVSHNHRKYTENRPQNLNQAIKQWTRTAAGTLQPFCMYFPSAAQRAVKVTSF